MSAMDLTQYVTRAELAGQLQPLSEIRTMLREDIRLLHEGQTNLSEQMRDMGQAITERMDIANHRTSKLETQLDTTAAEVDQVQKEVVTILEDGCHQRQQHIDAIRTLEHAGVLTDEPAEPRGFVRRHAKRGLIGGALVGAGVLIPHVWAAIHWLIEHLTFTP